MHTQALTRDVVIKIAKHKISDPLLKAFRARLLIAYTTGLRLEFAMEVSGKNIEDNCLMVDDQADKLVYIPLHPLIIRIFESYNDDFPIIRKVDIPKYNQELMTQMGITIQPYKSKENHKVVEKNVPTTRWLRQSMIIHMSESGLLDEDKHLLFGQQSKRPEDLKGRERELERLFKKPFFKHLKYLAKHHGI